MKEFRLGWVCSGRTGIAIGVATAFTGSGPLAAALFIGSTANGMVSAIKSGASFGEALMMTVANVAIGAAMGGLGSSVIESIMAAITASVGTTIVSSAMTDSDVTAKGLLTSAVIAAVTAGIVSTVQGKPLLPSKSAGSASQDFAVQEGAKQELQKAEVEESSSLYSSSRGGAGGSSASDSKSAVKLSKGSVDLAELGSGYAVHRVSGEVGWAQVVGDRLPWYVVAFHRAVHGLRNFSFRDSAWLSYVPIVGSVRDAYVNFDEGNYWTASMYAGLAAVEIATLGAGIWLKAGGRAAIGAARATRGVTTADGFLFRGFTVKTPFNIPVQRFGNMSLGRPDFWGARIGTSQFANRTFGAIKPAWNPLTQYTTGVIPKGTPIKFGIIGPQGWRYPGGSFQFIVPSRSVINQSSKLIR